MTNYKILADKIKSANTIDDIDKIEKSITNLYNNGILTVSELSRLDGLIMDKNLSVKV